MKSIKRQRFCDEYLTDCNGTQAAIRAGYSPKTANEQAAKLMATPEVKDEIERQRKALASAANVTVQSLLQETEAARVMAQDAGQPSAAVSAITLKAKLCGLLIERSEDMVKRDALERYRTEQKELQTAGKLLAEAAESLGLPRTATPAQIVGAIACNEISTPEAFRLIRAVQQAKDDEELL